MRDMQDAYKQDSEATRSPKKDVKGDIEKFLDKQGKIEMIPKGQGQSKHIDFNNRLKRKGKK